MPKVVNPYNFVPFGAAPKYNDAPARRPLADYYQDETALTSGWLDVELITKTELIIPDGAGAHKDQNDHVVCWFIRNPDGRVFIPGSELRGMIRSAYEAVTNSCLPFLPDDKPISQRTPLYAAFKNRGLLACDKEKNQWTLYSASSYPIPLNSEDDRDEIRTLDTGWFRGHRNGAEVSFTTSTKNVKKLKKKDGRIFHEYKSMTVAELASDHSENPQYGYLQFNKPVSDLNYSVRVLTKGEQVLQWEPGDGDPYQNLHHSIYDTVQNMKKKGGTAQKALLDRLETVKKQGGMLPVFYFKVERGSTPLVYLSGASAGRVEQRRTWREIMGEHCACESLEKLCPACALFGTTAGEGTRGRLRFSDAAAEAEEKTQWHTLPILSSPRSSAFEFYLRKPTQAATYWNFDYYGEREFSGNGTDYYDLAEAMPRGRKFYWHSDSLTPDRKEKDKQNATMESVGKRARFRFRIYFDRIAEEQLQQLIWLLTLGENREDSSLCHKLGHARPLGYGSVKLLVTGGMKRELNLESGRIRMFNRPLEIAEAPCWPFSDGEKKNNEDAMRQELIEALLKMGDRKATAGLSVAYPVADDKKNGMQIYKWFQNNRKNPQYLSVLPEPTAENITIIAEQAAASAAAQETKPGWTAPVQRDGKSQFRRATPADLEEAKRRYPLFTEVEGTVQNITRTGNVFVALPDTPCNAFLKSAPGYQRGDLIRVRITGYNEEKLTLYAKSL